VFVTNLGWKTLNLWRFYNQRATAELIIRELKDAHALGKIPTSYFAANEVFFRILLLAYNLLNWFKRLCTPPCWQRATLQRLRQRLLVVPAQLVHPASVPMLRTAPGYVYAEDFLDILKRVKTPSPFSGAAPASNTLRAPSKTSRKAFNKKWPSSRSIQVNTSCTDGHVVIHEQRQRLTGGDILSDHLVAWESPRAKHPRREWPSFPAKAGDVSL